MNNWFNALDAHVPAALIVLAQVTALLVAGFAVQQIVRRSPASRHAVLLWTLIAAGLSPILISAVRLAAIPAPFVKRSAVGKTNVLFGNLTVAKTVPNSSQSATASHFPFAAFFFALWAAGTLLSLLGLVRGLRRTRQIRRGAPAISAERIASARGTLLTTFGRTLPQICTSQIRRPFRWRLVTFGLSSCFRRHCWPSWTTSSSCRCLFTNARMRCAAMGLRRFISGAWSRSSGFIRWCMSSAACLIACAKKYVTTTSCARPRQKITRKLY